MPYHTRQQAVLRCLEQRREESLSAAELARSCGAWAVPWA